MKKLFEKIFAWLMLAMTVLSMVTGASAATVDDATIDMSRKGSMTLYKYDLTNAEKDGVWDSTYVSTGVYDADVNNTLGGTTPAGADSLSQTQGNGDVSYGYAIKGVEFTYLKIGDFRTYSETGSDGTAHIELLYGIPANGTTNTLLSAIGMSSGERVADADAVVNGQNVYYYRSSVLQKHLTDALAANETTVKNALENYVANNGGTAMPETDSYGKTAASNLDLGLYIVVETKVPEYVTDTTAPFFVTLPMTAVDGTNADNGGEEWLYDLTLYPKNLTGNPDLEKTVRESSADTGKNTGSTSITDGYAHTATASDGDVMDYQIISTMPTITSSSTYLSQYTFKDTLSAGLSYNKDVVIEFFTDASCTKSISTWHYTDNVKKFNVEYTTQADGSSVMTITMTENGLNEINTNKYVYTGANMVNSGYSNCTIRITYTATVHTDKSVVYGDAGNPNTVTLTWSRTSLSYYDVLVDDCHVYIYGIDLTKEFVDDKGNFSNVHFLFHNDTDNYYLTADFNASEGVYYVTGHAEGEEGATVFVPTDSGKILIKGLEDDTYTVTETQTDNGYSLLKDDIEIVIHATESTELCDIYDSDLLGLIQNDPRYTSTQKQLQHYLLTADATVDGNKVTMLADNDSPNALVPLTVINDSVFNLPQTGSNGNWMFPVFGLTAAVMAGLIIWLVCRKKNGSDGDHSRKA